ncbi:MAG: pyrimidine 5'-nucleotidase [Rickettsiales bacterium]|nr:pyrimidine 5'-nucleotidase [Rickettsiales bacterium]OUV82949.1 MAG: pyrimidine 5'-nucleotidase [Rickettsiales bacterium TMED131]
MIRESVPYLENKNMYDLLIDLDNTVYSEDSEIFQQIDAKMKSFISKKLNVSLDSAYKIQKKYFLENGTTLRGLMLYNNIDPEPFLQYVHDINLSSIKKNESLENHLKNYKGKKIIFTNGSKEHANRVLKKVGLERNIDAIFDIIDAGYIPKPDIATYKKVLFKYNLNPSNTVMIDDLPNNLKTAQKLGIKTALIKKNFFNRNTFDYIDIICSNLSDTIIKIKEGVI